MGGFQSGRKVCGSYPTFTPQIAFPPLPDMKYVGAEVPRDCLPALDDPLLEIYPGFALIVFMV